MNRQRLIHTMSPHKEAPLVARINKRTKDLALQILQSSFEKNANMNWIVNGFKDKRLESICKYCLNLAMIKDGAYISNDKKGVLLAYKSNFKEPLFTKIKLLINKIIFILTTIEFRQIAKIISQNSKVSTFLPSTPYIYCLMIATDAANRDLNTIINLKEFLFAIASHHSLPIYAQTSESRNLMLFKSKGFKKIGVVKNIDTNYNLYILKKNQ